MSSEKKAFDLSKIKGVLKNPAVQYGAAMTAAPMVAGGIAAGTQHFLNKSKFKRTHNDMVDLYPDLKKDKGTTHRLHKALEAVNPTYAGNPTIAGAWISHVKDTADMGLGTGNQALLSQVSEAGGSRHARVPETTKWREGVQKGTEKLLGNAHGQALNGVIEQAKLDRATDAAKFDKRFDLLAGKVQEHAARANHFEQAAGALHKKHQEAQGEISALRGVLSGYDPSYGQGKKASMDKVALLTDIETAKLAVSAETKEIAKEVGKDLTGATAGGLLGAALASKDQSRVVEGAKGVGRNVAGQLGGGALGHVAGAALKSMPGVRKFMPKNVGYRMGGRVGQRAGGAAGNIATVRAAAKHKKELKQREALEEASRNSRS